MTNLHDYVNPRNGKHSPLISDECYDIIMEHKDVCLIWCLLFNLKKKTFALKFFLKQILYFYE